MPSYYSWSTTGRRTSGTRSKTSKTTSRTGWSYSPTQFNYIDKNVQARINSYRTLSQQWNGPGKVTTFSPTTANKWVNLVDDGAYVYKFSNNDFCRHFGQQWNGTTSATAAYRWLRHKYGAGIKAVTRGKSNCWLVAATERVTARPFSSYNW